MSTSAQPLRRAVLGAGMAGILAAIELREAGVGPVAVFEKGDRFGEEVSTLEWCGGTWCHSSRWDDDTEVAGKRVGADPVLREQLRPSYRAACKRLVMSADFNDAVQLPNSRLVTDPIRRIEPTWPWTFDRFREVLSKPDPDHYEVVS